MELGTKVYHRNLKLHDVVVPPPFMGIDPGYTVLVEFEDGETREVSIHLLESIPVWCDYCETNHLRDERHEIL